MPVTLLRLLATLSPMTYGVGLEVDNNFLINSNYNRMVMTTTTMGVYEVFFILYRTQLSFESFGDDIDLNKCQIDYN